jgi:hypothetical protein
MMTRYLSGLCVAGLGLCGGGWLVVAAVAFGGLDGGDADRVNLATGAGLMVVCCVTAAAWAAAWRRRMRADGVLGERFAPVSRRQARRNRRELKRDVRRAARSAKRSAREARRRARRFPRRADGELGGLGGLGLGGGSFGGGLTGTGSLGSGLSGGGLGEPRGWIGGGRTGHAPHGTGREGPVPAETGRIGPEPAGPEPTGAKPEPGGGGPEPGGAEPEPGGAGPEPSGAGPEPSGAGGADTVPGRACPSAEEVLGQLRALLGPLLNDAGGEPACPPLPRRQPGQERPQIPRRQAGQGEGGAAEPATELAAEPTDAPAAAPAGGLLDGDQELLNLADSEEAWW